MRLAALALARRGVREDARSLARALLRSGLVALLILVVAQASVAGSLFGAPGQRLFVWIININALFIAALGISTFSGAITEEKEQSTLGLLQLAGFGPLAILLGKSLGQLCSALLLLAVQLPFAMLSVTLGGVAIAQVVSGYIVLASFLLAVYGVALLFSVLFARTSSAGWSTGVVVLGSWIVPPILASAIGRAGSGLGGAVSAAAEFVADLSVFSGLQHAARVGTGDYLPVDVVTFHVVVAVVALSLSWLWFDRFNRQEVAAAPERGWVAVRRRSSKSRPGPGARAFFWKDFHFVAGGGAGVTVRVVVYALVVLLVSAVSPRAFGRSALPMISMAVAQFSLVLLALEYGVMASRLFHEEVKWKTLSGLAICPYPVRAWAYRKASAGIVALLPGTACFTVFALLCSGSGMGRLSEMYQIWAFILSNVVLGSHVAVYFSLIVRRGAFALALVAMFVLTLLWTLGAHSCLTGGAEGYLSVSSLAYLGLAACLHPVIGAKLREVAGR